MSTSSSFCLIRSQSISVPSFLPPLCRFFYCELAKNRKRERWRKGSKSQSSTAAAALTHNIFLFLHSELLAKRREGEEEKDGWNSSPGTPLICTKSSSNSCRYLNLPAGEAKEKGRERRRITRVSPEEEKFSSRMKY